MTKPFTPEQFQMLLEVISAQTMVAVLEHEARVHMPTSTDAARRLRKANEVRKSMIAETRQRLVEE